MPVVSVVVPVYKVEQYICPCLDSILAQTFQDFEVILVDDGSPDSCGMICDEYARKDSRIQVIHQENGGVSRARNAALEKVTGKYVTFCDSDDRYAETWLQSLVTAMDDTNADMVLGGFVKMLEDEVIRSSCHKAEVVICATESQKLDYCMDRILHGDHGWEVWARLFRTDLIRDNNIRFCETCHNFAEDMGFVLEYACYTSCISVINETGYLYTERSGSMMNTSIGKVKLDSLNEVAISVIDRMEACFEKNETKRMLPVVHYMIMDNQYIHIVEGGFYRQFHSYTKPIRRCSEWRTWSWRMFGCGQELRARFGRQKARWIMLHNFYHLFGIWPVFSLGCELIEKTERKEVC